MRRVAVVLSVLAVVVVGLVARGRPTTTAQDGTPLPAGHPLVGSWSVTVSFDGQPPLVLPNLATFTSDGTVVVAAPSILPETPGGPAVSFFSAGHGAWAAADVRGADVRFVFLVSDEAGHLLSINTVRGTLQVDDTDDAYTGRFNVEIEGPTGGALASLTGTWQATRIGVGSVESAGTPGGGTPAAGTPAP